VFAYSFSQSCLGVPGSLSVGLVDAHTLSVNERFDHVHALTFWYGNRLPTDNVPLYQAQVREIYNGISDSLTDYLIFFLNIHLYN
jgi:hypothetical protein